MTVLKKIIPYIIIIALVIIVRSYFFIPIVVNGSSMEPTFEHNQLLLLNRITYQSKSIKRFEIIVFKHEDKPLVKRIIGLPGDEVLYKDGNLYINNKEVEEEFAREETTDFEISELGATTVPEGKYFVMGDNRDNSTDSRTIGFVSKDSVMGKVSILLYPLNKFEIIK